MNIWFTSDMHFGHFNIIKYCKRPFKTLEQMNNTLIKNWNMRVKPGDIVFHVGDWSFHNTSGGKKGEGELHNGLYYEKQLNGKVIHVEGNHDKNNKVKTIIQNMEVKYGGLKIYVTHRPQVARKKYKLNLVGHIHDKWKIKKLGKNSYMINVGVDVWNYRPVSINEILTEYYRFKKRYTEARRKKSVRKTRKKRRVAKTV